jgi:hypothetical protein
LGSDNSGLSASLPEPFGISALPPLFAGISGYSCIRALPVHQRAAIWHQRSLPVASAIAAWHQRSLPVASTIR